MVYRRPHTSVSKFHLVSEKRARINRCHPAPPSGPPSPPESVTVEEVTDSTAQLAWSPGRDNGSPIASYVIQTRTPFTVGWQRVNTGRQGCKISSYSSCDGIQMIHGSPQGNFLFLIPPSAKRSECGASCRMKAVEIGWIQDFTLENRRPLLPLLYDLI